MNAPATARPVPILAAAIAIVAATIAALVGCTPAAGRPADAAPAGGDVAPDAPPNVVLIVADDLGYADVGFQGCRDIPTPAIDRIAAGGVRFTNGYVTGAVCGPSRAGLITGRYQDRFGASRNPTIDPSMPNGVPRTERTIAEMLRGAGYRSMAVGKWHLGTYPGLQPQDRGFDEFYGFLSGGHEYLPEALTLEDLSEVRRRWDWYRTKLLHNGRRVATDAYLTDKLSDAAVEFIERPGNETPFFVYMAYNAPHTPLQATPEYLDRFAHIGDKKRRTYAAMVSAMDDGIGRILAALDRAGVADRTIVAFISDNGGAANNASSNGPLRGHKSDPWEGGVRVPFAMRWPGVIPAGLTYDHPVSSLDLAATLVAAAGPGASATLDPQRPLDGVDLVPHLDGSNPDRPHQHLFWRWYDQGAYAVRSGDLKLIVSEKPGGPRGLYNLAADPGERTNLRGTPEGEADAERLDDLAKAWMAELIPPAYPGLGSWRPGEAPAADGTTADAPHADAR